MPQGCVTVRVPDPGASPGRFRRGPESVTMATQHHGAPVTFQPQRLLDGPPLDQPADGNVLVCCSQPVRDVVIDL